MSLDRLSAALSDRYRIERELGAGGMATVYLSEDLRHHRRVAVKVLRPELAAVIGAERFLSEITTTANLQHPHILPLFDSGTADGFLFYVMPYVEGESLRDRLTREKQLPIGDAVRIAGEIAGALDYAHRHGVIHRDIKPENILLHDGRALVADFGIALAASKAGNTRMTETGMSLGTPHYMSPEQAMGEREITARSDVYALGCITYEMLCGEPPFGGPTAQAIVAKVLTEVPRPLLPKRHTIPPHVEAAVLVALEKLPADRYESAAAFARALADPAQHRSGFGPTGTVALRAARGSRVTGRLAPLAIAAAVIFAVLAAWGWFRGAASAGPTREYISFGDSLSISTLAAGPSLALSPDGKTIALKDSRQNGLLWIKRQELLEATPLLGTERASNPVFSPDGEWLLFTADQQLKKVKLTTGTIVTLASDSVAVGFGGGAWLDDGTVIYVGARLSKLMRVSAGGGPSTEAFDNRELQGSGFGHPTPLPGARGVLFISCSSGCATMALRVLDLRTGTQHLLVSEAGQSWYLPTGQLLYTRRDGTSLLAPFDLDKLEVTGAGVPVLTGVFVSNGYTQLAWSPTGALIYAAGQGANIESTYLRVTRAGVATPIDPAWHGTLLSLSPSPDGTRLAVGVGGGTGALNIYIKKLEQGPFTRLSFGGADRRPAWSPDGKMVAFIRDTFATSLVVGRYADGSRPDTVLMRIGRQIQGVEWSPDMQWLVARTDNSVAGAGDLVGVRTHGDTTPVELVSTPFSELHPAVSPDSRWLAYTSNETGRNEVYVRPFPNTNDGHWQISTAGGIEPRWSRDGSEIFFLGPPGKLYAARIATRPSFVVTGIGTLFDVTGYVIDAFQPSYALSADGRGFIFSAPLQGAGPARAMKMVRVEGWFRELRATSAE